MPVHTFTIEPHPTAKGKVLAITPKPESWHCLTDTERAFDTIGGIHWRGWRGEGVAYTLTPAQARDLDLILRAGWLAASTSWNGWPPAERTFWHPDRDEELTRAELVEMLAPPPRCTRTLEMSF